MTTLDAAPRAAGLVHLGLVYDDVGDLVARCLPEIHDMLDAGGAVSVAVDRRNARGFRDALGTDAGRVTFPAPGAVFARDTVRYLDELRRTLRRDRPTLMIGQYSTAHPTTWDSRHAEDAVNLVLADLPLTVVCVCDAAGAGAHRGLLARSHPHLVDADGRVPNPAWRRPAGCSPAPLAAWGPPVATLEVADAHGLAALRDEITARAGDAGLSGEARDAAVLAAHEAVLLAGGGDPDAVAPLAGAIEVEVRVVDGVVLSDVRCSEPAAHTNPSDWRAELLPRFCRRTATYDDVDGRRVRVLSAR